VTDRLSSLDASFLYLEEPTTAMHVSSVMVFQPPEGGFDYERLVGLIARRIDLAPRYRQVVRDVPGRLANPVWVDDTDFDLSYHVRRSALPRPGTDEQLEEFVARVQPRPLDRARPLWEVYLIEGLQHGRFAIVSKTHQALVDGVNAIDIAHLLVSSQPGEIGELESAWRPSPSPSDLRLIGGAVFDTVRAPGRLLNVVREGMDEVRAVGSRAADGLGSLVTTLARTAARPAPSSPLNTEIGTARRFLMVGTDLADYRTIRARVRARSTDEDLSVNDVVLATVTGAFRAWLLTRGEAVHSGTVIRAMVPVSMYDTPVDTESAPALGNRLAACFVDLPVGEPVPAMRLHQVSFQMRQQIENGHAVEADTLAGVAGFASPTLHSLAARLGSAASRRFFNVMVTNVPGPQSPLYVGPARMLSTYPVMPLAKGQALAIGLTSYDGGVYYGLNADRASMPDVDMLGQSLVDSLTELLAGTGRLR
jgi:WS/DGAT/MGAT family acyltransferase